MEQAENNIIQVFLKAAGQSPQTPALVQDGAAISYAQLLAQVRTAAGALQRKGIGRGDAVLVFVPMSVALYRTVLALLYLGARPVFLDEWVSLARLKACCELVPCRALIAPLRLRLLAPFNGPLRRIPVKCGPHFDDSSPAQAPTAVHPSETALITFTTGSTGVPKAADRSHHFLQEQLRALRPLLEDGIQTSLTLLPIVVLLNMALGKTTLLPPLRFRAKVPPTYPLLAQAVATAQPGSAIVSPGIAATLLSTTEPAALRSLRRLLTGGGPVFPELARQLEALVPGCEMKAVYGSTEAEPIAHTTGDLLREISAEALLQGGLPVGQVDPHARVAILPWQPEPMAFGSDAALLAAACTGIAGEIVVSGGHVLEGYISNPAAEERYKIRTGTTTWHRTGDCGRLDADGNLFLYGRCGDEWPLVGNIVYPMLAEYFIAQTAGIALPVLLRIQGKLVLVLEKAARPREGAVREALSGIFGTAPLPELRYMKRIPRDPRHQTKVDRTALQRLLR